MLETLKLGTCHQREQDQSIFQRMHASSQDKLIQFPKSKAKNSDKGEGWEDREKTPKQ